MPKFIFLSLWTVVGLLLVVGEYDFAGTVLMALAGLYILQMVLLVAAGPKTTDKPKDEPVDAITRQDRLAERYVRAVEAGHVDAHTWDEFRNVNQDALTPDQVTRVLVAKLSQG